MPESLLFLTGQIAFMKRRGFEITVISSPGEALTSFAAREGIAARAIPMPRRITPLRDLASLRTLIEALREIRPDIVHAHTPKAGLLGMLAAAACSVPTRIYHMRGLPLMTARGRRRALLTLTERISCALAARVLCVSPSLRDAAIAERLVGPAKIAVLGHGSGNGVDAQTRFNPDALSAAVRPRVRAELGIPKDALVVGFVGRVVRDKGIEELWRAWQSLRETFPSAHLLIVGPFEPQDPIASEATSGLSDDPRVRLLPFSKDMPSLYASMDVVALPTYREGFPNVPLEAAAMRLPIVATRVTGCVDAVEDGVTGVLVPARDPIALAGALETYLRDPALRARHADAGRARVVAKFQQVPLWEELEALYRRALRGRAVSPLTVLQPGPRESH